MFRLDLKTKLILVILAAATSFAAAGQPVYNLDFYGIDITVPKIAVDLPDKAVGADGAFSLRGQLKTDKTAERLVPQILEVASSLGFNSYLTYDLVNHMVDKEYAGKHSSSRAVLKHHLLTALGMKVRLATNSYGDGVLLLAFAQPVYDRKMLFIDGFRYYMFGDDDLDMSDPLCADVKPLRSPSDSSPLLPINLRLGRLNIPYEPYHYEFTDSVLTLSGEVNRNLFAMLYRYPRTDVKEVSLSAPSPDVRAHIVDQMKPQLQGMKQKEAVNALLHFMQHAFPYATDEELHGFEKPYLIEEMLFHKASDCEDRAILYTFLLWNCLDIPCAIIGFTDHESVAVCLENSNVRGTSYPHRGRDYYISDPTFKGARTGKCMDQYAGQTPEVHFELPPADK